ncbi:AbrB/MazE/SpoVT family DNA-binding domain-containing protein [Pedobacter sp.]|uniref:AbrB/MazE/SpoVT family DNA-binding domain-containing protein n=1 Tax=Pedobacter sp. TaxID=1411316 RepID=UPI003D7F361C
MKTNIINIGNSQGIILPATVLRKLNLSFKSTVHIDIIDGAIIIKPDPRQGWAEAAQQMHASGDDELLLDDVPTDFDQEEWTW